MNPVAKYLLARLGLFAVIAVPLSFFINMLLAALIGLIASLLLSTLLLKNLRTEMIDHIDAGVKRRQDEKRRLRAELNGDDEAADATAERS